MMIDPQPSIEIFDLVIHTPVTAITDVIVASICLWAYRRIAVQESTHPVKNLFKYYFLSMALATFLGGVVGHALMHYLPFYMKLPGWITSMLSIALLERAVIMYARRFINPKIGLFFSWLNVVELLSFMVLALTTLNFQYVLIHAAYGMAIVVAGFGGFIFYKEKSLGSLRILQAVGVCATGAFFFEFKIGLDKWFNHVDISHVFMMWGSYLYYQGGSLMIQSHKIHHTNN